MCTIAAFHFVGLSSVHETAALILKETKCKPLDGFIFMNVALVHKMGSFCFSTWVQGTCAMESGV